MGSIDTTSRQTIGVVTTPPTINTVTTGLVTVPANSARSFAVTTTPLSIQLSIWNFLFSIVIDDTTIGAWPDGSQQYLNLYSDGPSLTSGQLLTQIENWLDWAKSSDTTNVRVHKIRIHNNDSSPHTYYLLYKGYTWAARAGIS